MSRRFDPLGGGKGEVIEPPRPTGLMERLPAAPVRRAATYGRTDGEPAAGDRRRRRRAGAEPWRGRFVDLVG